jgi:sigma-B regulation protein RsbU (phosphoserine phosphatase)
MTLRVSQPQSFTRSLKVLLADDQPDVLTALSLLLKAEGWVTRSVTSPEDIISALDADSFDAVLMDLNYQRDTTSGKEGLELLSQIEGMDHPPPVVVMTAWGSIDLAVEAMRRGARDFVIKPWDNQKLIDTLRRHAVVKGESPKHEADTRYSSNEFQVASQVQQKLFPERGRTLGSLEVAGHCKPAGAVGGDSYDFIDVSYDRLAFVLADVSGKGLPAALMMANLQATLRSGIPRATEELPVFLAQANRLFFESTQPYHYATLFLGVYDEPLHRLRYVNCGHPAAILLRADGSVERLASTATAFGLFEELAAEVVETSILSGDTLVAFSDGVVEAVQAEGDELGDERLIDMLRHPDECLCVPFPDLPHAILDEILGDFSYQQTDDMTLIVAHGRT